MAVLLDVSTVAIETQLAIKNDLTLVPVKKPLFGKSQFYGKKKEEDPICCYFAVDSVLYVPLSFGCTISRSIPNATKTYPVVPIEFTGTLRDYQVPVFAEMCQHFAEFHTSSLFVYPGFGKTLMGAIAMAKAKLLGCVLLTMTLLIDQWAHTFTKVTNAKYWIVGEPMPSEFSVIICMEERWTAIPEYIRDAVGFLIIDEAHMFCTPSRIAPILAFRPRYLLIETATPKRADKSHSFLTLLAGNHHVMRKFPHPVSLFQVNTRCNIGDIKGKQWSSVVKLLTEDTQRNLLIARLVATFQDNKWLFISARENHVKECVNLLRSYTIRCDYMTGEKKTYQESTVLIGNYHKMATGFDEASFCDNYSGVPIDAVVVIAPIKDEILITQTFGRALRSQHPKFYYFVDDNDLFRNQFRQNVRTVKREFPNVTISTIDPEALAPPEALYKSSLPLNFPLI